MALLLLSGRPGAGKTEFSQWLSQTRHFEYIETDQSNEWQKRLQVSTAIKAQETKERTLALGDDVIVEWGFIPTQLFHVRLLRHVGFATWWFDADEPAARQLWRQRRPNTPLDAYERQTKRIQEAWPTLSKFYSGRIVRTVEPGPIFMPPEAIAAQLLAAES